MSSTGEKMLVPLPQSIMNSGAEPPGRFRITRLMPVRARKPDSATMIGCTRTKMMIRANSSWYSMPSPIATMNVAIGLDR